MFVAVLGNVELGPEAKVHGDVVVVGGELTRDPKATVSGHVQNVLGVEWRTLIGCALGSSAVFCMAGRLRSHQAGMGMGNRAGTPGALFVYSVCVSQCRGQVCPYPRTQAATQFWLRCSSRCAYRYCLYCYLLPCWVSQRCVSRNRDLLRRGVREGCGVGGDRATLHADVRERSHGAYGCRCARGRVDCDGDLHHPGGGVHCL